MKKLHFLLFFVMAITIVSNGQNNNDTIAIKKVWGSYQFYQNDRKLSMKEVVDKMKSNEQAYSHIKSARTNKTWSTIIGSVGGFMVGWTLGTAVGGGDPNWTVAGIGAGLIIVSIPINQKFNKQSRRAVDIYNGTSSETGYNRHWNLLLKPDAVGLTVRF